MKASTKRVVGGIAFIAAIDLAGIAAMIANPNLTERVLPALIGIQILGFPVIAALAYTNQRDSASPDKSYGGIRPLFPWIFGFLALMNFLRLIMAIFYIAGEPAHSRSWFGVILIALMAGFFSWLAFKTRRSVSKTDAVVPGTDA